MKRLGTIFAAQELGTLDSLVDPTRSFSSAREDFDP